MSLRELDEALSTDEQHRTNPNRYMGFFAGIDAKFPAADYDTVHVLDVGSSTGEAIEQFLTAYQQEHPNTAFNAVALDAESSTLETARNEEQVDEVVQASGTHLPFESESFDIVVSSNYLPHYASHDEQALAVNDMYRVLQSDGVAALDLHNDEADSYTANTLGGFYVFTKDELETVLDETEGLTQLPFEERDAYQAQNFYRF